MRYSISIDNIGGIRKGSVTLSDGLNAVRASNWKGKSSFLIAIKAVMGAGTPLTEFEEQGYVDLKANGDQYHIELQKENGSVVRRGNPYITDEYTLASAELFAFLDEDNKVREAVRRGVNLEDLLTRPLDMENIEERIDELIQERNQIDCEIEEVEKAAKQVPAVQESITQLEAKLDNLRAQRTDIQTGRTDSSELIEKRDKLSDLRAEKESIENRLERLKTSLERNRTELETKREKLESHEIPDRESVAETLKSKRDELQQIEHDIELLQTLYSANKRIISEDRLDLITDVEHSLIGDTIDCWVCGSEAGTATIEDRLQSLADRISEMKSSAESRRDRINSLQSKLNERRQAEKKEEQLQREISRLEEKIADHEQSQASAQDRLEQLTSDIEVLTEEVEDLDEKMTDIESEIKIAERKLSESRKKLESLQAKAKRQETLQTQREQVVKDLTELRNRRDTIKQELRSTFDESMQEILKRFNTGIDGARLTSQFDIVVARNGHEASLETLSEGERELIGVITALTGYEVFDVSDDVPIVLLDELGGFAEDNLFTLIEYLEERVDSLVFTAYPEHESIKASEIELTEFDLLSEEAVS